MINPGNEAEMLSNLLLKSLSLIFTALCLVAFYKWGKGYKEGVLKEITQACLQIFY